MTGILIDSYTGDIVLDENNNTIEVDNERAFKQIIDGLFHCDVGSEIMNPEYGFDLKGALQESYGNASEESIESFVIQALDNEREKLISTIEYVQADRDGSNMNVTVIVTSILNDSVQLNESVSV